ncbi:MAG: leucine-rich repeat domain-containing protein [Alphaproteobacteria bacterium]|nr:leucine-rich repeat domain-containing protein [Alphaproteobacteria bacterium]
MKKFLILIVLFVANNAYAGGSCGSGCTWELKPVTDKNGAPVYLEDGETQAQKLIISAKGESGTMSEYGGANNTPWWSSHESITSIEVQNGIKNIGRYAFWAYTNVTSISLPDTLTSIGNYAFQSNNLSSVVIPDSVTSIGYQSFFRNPNLTSVVIEGTPSVGGIAFRDSPAKIYCLVGHTACAGKGGTVVYYEKDKSGALKVGDDYYASSSDLVNDTKCTDGLNEACVAKALNVTVSKLLAKGKCTSQAECQTIVTADYNGEVFQVGLKSYASLDDFLIGQAIPKRIYTIEEAERVSKKTGNTFKLRYK